MRYQVTISRAGHVIQNVEVEAPTPLAAINQLEAAYEKFAIQLSIRPGEVITVYWTGYEFEVRQLNLRNEN